MAAPDDPNVVRAVIERQIEYLGEQVSRIDGEHEEIQDTLDDMRRALDGDQELPAARVHGEEATVWLVDQAAAGELPYFECSV